MRESAIMDHVRLALSNLKVTTFRNNVGRLKTEDGRWVNFGLCPGSSDIIGFYEHIVTENDVGRRVAVFSAFETKTSIGRPTDEQLAFVGRVGLSGGIAGIVRSPMDAVLMVERWKRRGA